MLSITRIAFVVKTVNRRPPEAELTGNVHSLLLIVYIEITVYTLHL